MYLKQATKIRSNIAEAAAEKELYMNKKNVNLDMLKIKVNVLQWQREKDSNPHIRSQSPLCYLYTIPLSAKIIISI